MKRLRKSYDITKVDDDYVLTVFEPLAHSGMVPVAEFDSNDLDEVFNKIKEFERI